MRPLPIVAAIAALVAAGVPARADTVALLNGQHLENVRVEEAGPHNIAVTRPGMRILIPKKEVLSIERAETSDESLARLVKEADGDPGRLSAAARFAREHGLGDRGREIEEIAVDARLERTLAGVDRRDADALYAAGQRALEAKLPRDAVERVFRLALLANPDHALSHRALGERLFEGRWLTDAEASSREADRRADEMRAKGLVFFEGEWITPDVKRFDEERRALERELAAARKLRQELEAALAQANAREDVLARREAAVYERERMLAVREAALTWDGIYAPPCYGVSGGVIIVNPGSVPTAPPRGIVAGRRR